MAAESEANPCQQSCTFGDFGHNEGDGEDMGKWLRGNHWGYVTAPCGALPQEREAHNSLLGEVAGSRFSHGTGNNL